MTETSEPHERAHYFEATAAEAEREAAALRRRAERLALGRLGAFVLVVVATWLLGTEVHPAAGVAALVLGVAGFNRLVGAHQELSRRAAHAERRGELLRGELASLRYDFAAFDGGEEWVDATHPYTGDLDVFGAHSAFQQLNRTATVLGRSGLAQWCTRPLEYADHVVERQRAVGELAARPEFRFGFLAEGSGRLADADALAALRRWSVGAAYLTAAWWPVALVALPIFNVAWLVSFAYLPFMPALLGYAPTAWLLYRYRAHVDTLHRETESAAETLATYARMLTRIERETWAVPLLGGLARRLRLGGSVGSAGEALTQLAHLTRQLGLRVNPFVLLLNLFLLWELRYARKLEQWRARYAATTSASRPAPDRDTPADVDIAAASFTLPGGKASTATGLDGWLLALGAFDALSSFAGAAFRWPHWTFPEVLPEGDADELSGAGLHHPLLPPGESVANDFASATRGTVHLLTGSNMAGKSTFLRTVGLHAVMAQWGCPTPCASLRLPCPLRVYTSMRTQDALHRGASAFYAELERLRVVVGAVERGEPAFFLLDEILKGTNSHDRHAGARAVILQLLRARGAGIVATHDLELGELAEATDGAVRLLRLEVETDAAGELYFDYRVKPGLAESRNASALMRRMGLGVGAAEA